MPTRHAPVAEGERPGFWRAQMARTFWRALRRNTRWARSLPPLGRAVTAALGPVIVCCVDPGRRGPRVLFAFLLSALVVSAIWARWAPLRRLLVSRSLPPFARAGEPFAYELRLANSAKRPISRLDGRDGSRPSQPSLRSWTRSRWWPDPALNLFDRVVGYPRWLALAERSEAVSGERFNVDRIEPGQSVSIHGLGLCRVRGVLSFEGVWAGSRDPFGLWRALRWLPATDALPCLPAAGPRLREARAQGVAQGQAPRESRAPSLQGEHLAGLRQWRPADGRRAIAWRASERAGQLLAREWNDPAARSRALAIDPRLPSGLAPEEARAQFESVLSAAFDWAREQDGAAIAAHASGAVHVGFADQGDGELSRLAAALASAEPLEGEAGEAALLETLDVAHENGAIVLLACARVDARLTALTAAQGRPIAFLELDPDEKGDAPPREAR
jgi:uncharacterized protein (DUF58 family)